MSDVTGRAGARLKDKVILVTGSTTGIGEGMVRVFTREGARVMIHGRRREEAQTLAEELPRSLAPAGRPMTPKEVAWAAVYFLSDEAALINGAVLDMSQHPMIGRNPRKVVVP